MTSSQIPPQMPPHSAPQSPARPPLVRSQHDRLLAGVCAGLAEHLGVPVASVRWITVGASLLGGVGVLAYAWFAFTMPSVDAAAPIGRLVPSLAGGKKPAGRWSSRQIMLGVLAAALLLLAVGLVAREAGLLPDASWLAAVVLAGAGLVIAWVQIADLGAEDARSKVLLRLGGGTGLVVTGMAIFLTNGRTVGQVMGAVGAGLAIVAGVGLVFAPLGLRLWRELTDTRAAQAREAERADIAAHLHDSVLQTLTLIRNRADDPAQVRTLARAQERELRQWLYTRSADHHQSLDEQLRALAAAVEDRYQVAIEVVIVGEFSDDDGSTGPGRTAAVAALVGAAGEALTNAAKHGKQPISVFAEFSPEVLEVFVRDRGPGFDPAQIAQDRHGVRESIVARMARHGGQATIRSDATRGTDVQLRLPLG